jgi:hypothetical protein
MVTSGGADLLKDIQSGIHEGDDEHPASAAALNTTIAVLPKSRTRNIDPIRPRMNLGRTARSVKADSKSAASERLC